MTSVLKSAAHAGVIALGYVRKEVNGIGTELVVKAEATECSARVTCLPFQPSW